MIILGTNSIKDTGFNVDNSVRMSGATVNLQRDFSGDGNRRTWTYSTWFKLSNIKQSGFFNWGKGNPEFSLRFESATSNTANNYFRVSQYDNAQILDLVTTQFFADPAAWGHMVVAFDTTQGTASNRVKVYFNGTQITSFSTASYPDEDFETFVNQASKKHYIGYADYEPINGYLCETVFIDGQQLAPDQFGEFDSDSNIWKPIDVSGLTFGTNGYYLQYKEAGTSQNASGIGADTSGGTNHFAVDDVVATDQSTDTCTNNFATFNPLVNNNGENMTLSEGNLVATGPDSSHNSAFSTFGVTTGKWYWEAKFVDASDNLYHGVAGSNILSANAENPMNSNGFTGWNNGDGGEILKDGDNTSNDYGTLGDNDILGVALNADDYQITFYKNGSALVSNHALSTTGRDTLFVLHVGSSTSAVSAYNFGSPPYAISFGNTDGDGFGNFEYAPPSGYFALCTKNLAEYG